MIQTYVLDSAALPDPFGEQAAPDGQWEGRLSGERLEQIRRIRHPGARKQSLGAGLLLEHMRRRIVPDVRIQKNAYGKPFCTGVPFNLSHTADAVILSVWESAGRLEDAAQPCADLEFCEFGIGCDIERVKPYEPRIARRFFTRAEYESLEALQEERAQAELFYRYWTKKESVMKLAGLGISLPMDLYDVRGAKVSVDTKKARQWYWQCIRKGQEKPGFEKAAEIVLHRGMFLKEYRYQEYCITVCSTRDAFAPEMIPMYFNGQRLENTEDRMKSADWAIAENND